MILQLTNGKKVDFYYKCKKKFYVFFHPPNLRLDTAEIRFIRRGNESIGLMLEIKQSSTRVQTVRVN